MIYEYTVKDLFMFEGQYCGSCTNNVITHTYLTSLGDKLKLSTFSVKYFRLSIFYGSMAHIVEWNRNVHMCIIICISMFNHMVLMRHRDFHTFSNVIAKRD